MENLDRTLDQKIQELESEIERLNRVIDIKNGEIEMLQSTVKLSLMVLRGYELEH
jgi:predicted RNase H-like nuclease (RuvC/YqgF family)